MQRICLSCRKHTHNLGSKVTVANKIKVIRNKSRWAICWPNNQDF